MCFELVLDGRSYFVVLLFIGLGSVGGGTVRVGRVARAVRARVRLWLDREAHLPLVGRPLLFRSFRLPLLDKLNTIVK